MSDQSAIEWTDRTWNPLTGCTKVSPGCDNCYAKPLRERFHGPGSFDTVVLHPERLDQPLRWRKPSKVFVNSMSDLFHADVPDEFIHQVFAVMAATPQHTYQVLTKRHARMRALLSGRKFRPTPNVWLGVSVEDQHWADIRIPALLETPAAVRWISAEPLLGPVDLADYLACQDDRFGHGCNGCSLDWVVVGGETGHGARPMHPQWARDIRDQCSTAGVPFFLKQRGVWTWDLPDRIPARHMYGPAYIDLDGQGCAWAYSNRPGVVEMWNVGKKVAGRLLDGVQHDGYPTVGVTS